MIIKPETVYISPEAEISPSATIMPYCVITGNTKIGENTVVCSFSRIDSSEIGRNCSIGPYARLRENCVISDYCRVGNFVEVKNSLLGRGVKAAHLTYIGDAEIGSGSNVGCGVIFCNYDGKKKHRSVIGERCFIGSNVNLIAPLSVGSGSFVAAGTTVDRSVPENSFVRGNRDLKIVRNVQVGSRGGKDD